MFRSVEFLLLDLVNFNSIVINLHFEKLPSKNIYFTVFFFFSFEGWFEFTESEQACGFPIDFRLSTILCCILQGTISNLYFYCTSAVGVLTSSWIEDNDNDYFLLFKLNCRANFSNSVLRSEL